MSQKVKVKVEGKVYVGIKEGEELFTSIKDSTSILNFKHNQYTRRLLLDGSFDPNKTGLKVSPLKVKEGKFSKWYIPIKSLYAYLSSRKVRDSTRRFILRFDMEHKAKVEEALKASGVEYTLELAYKKEDSKGKKKATTPKEEETPLEEFTFKAN